MTLQQQGVGGAPPSAPVTSTTAATTTLTAERELEQHRPSRLVSRIVFYVLLFGATLIFVFPFVWLISASLKTRQEVFSPELFAFPLQFDNYAQVFQIAPVASWFFNSVVVGLLAATAVTISSALVAFGFAYFRFPGRNILFGLVLASMMLPGAVVMIPNFLIWNALGQVNSPLFTPLWAGNLFGSAFYIFLLRQFFLGLPRETFEAARVDGASYPRMFWSVALPLTRAALIVVFIFELKASWTDLMKPLIFMRDIALFTLPQGLKALVDRFNPQIGGQGEFQLVMAASVIVTIPMIVVFFLAQRYFIEGIATTGSKG
ncbi:MAG TPA: carbohydrate ABC transporter permease [Candidatus Limnocylindrales bacterium]|nr:carbohydrate ABC transporter permease [Candidatus Limnocylindrales bacterium]